MSIAPSKARSQQVPTKYQLVINVKTAKALGIALLALADEVID